MQRPKRGQIYTYEEITKLKLDDIPNLGMPCPPRLAVDECYRNTSRSPIQDSHITEEELLPVLAEARFEYKYTTGEWVPVFDFVGDYQDALKFVDYELNNDPYEKDGYGWWVTPKGHPREQFYKVDPDRPHELYDDLGPRDYREMPQVLIDAYEALKKKPLA